MQHTAIQRMRDFMKSDEGKAHMERYAANLRKARERTARRIAKIHSIGFAKVANAVYNKYTHANKFTDDSPLCWLLYEYAQVHGREATKDEFGLHSTMFTQEMYIHEGFCFVLDIGQGSHLSIFKL